MKAAKLADNEVMRLKSLKDLSILDTNAESCFDDVVQLAASICQTPIALISLVDETRQWFKAKVGLDASETPRELAFCAHAILKDEPFCIQNAFEDDRFSDNPLSTGAPHVVFYTGVPVKSPEGFNVGTLCVIDKKPRKLDAWQMQSLERLSRQVTELFRCRIIQKNLTKKNENLAAFDIALNLNYIIAKTDARGKIIHVNDNFCKISEYSRSELIGKDHRILNSGSHPKEFFKDVWDTIKSGRPWNGIIKNKTKSGNFYWVNTTISPIFDETGNLIEFLSIRNDVTNEILNLDKALSAEKAKSEFLANMNHELRTPLNAMIGIASLFTQDGLSHDQKNDLQTILKTSEHLKVLVEGILEFTETENKNQKPKETKFNLKSLLADIQKVYSSVAEKKNLKLHFEAKDLPSDFFIGIPTKLRQAISILVDNALKFTSSGSVRIATTSHALQDDLYSLEIEVSDTGIGIAKVDLASLFIPFNQIDSSSTRHFSGSGLGLAICKKIIDGLGGKITVDSEIGRGSKFSVNLPIQAAQLQDPKNADGEDKNISGSRILVVDDNPINVEVICRMLARIGYVTHSVTDGQQAIKYLKHNSPDLILMDFQMPVLDGFETTKQIRSHRNLIVRKIPIIGVTANAIRSDLDKCLEVGMNAYLTKPLNEAELKTKVWEFMNPKSDKDVD